MLGFGVERVSTRALGLLVLAVSFALYLPGVSTQFFSTGEPREALVAQSMLLHGDPFISVRYDHDFATKPPLLHWLIAGSAILLGELNEMAARLPSVLFASFALFFWFLFVNLKLGRQTAILTVMILATTGEWYRYAAMSRVDMVFSVMMLCGAALLYNWHETKKRIYLGIAIAPLSLAALTKGPVGILVPLFITALWLLLQRELAVKRLFELGVLGTIAIMPLALWYVSQSLAVGEQSLSVAMSENYLRLIGKMSEGEDPHSHGMFYLFGVFLSGLLPWSFMVLAVPFLRPQLLRLVRSTVPSEQRFIHWCMIFVTCFFLLFLIPESKRSVYLLPIYPQAAVLLALLLDVIGRRESRLSYRIILIPLFIFLLAGFGCLLLQLGYNWFEALPLSPKHLLEFHFVFEVLQKTRQTEPLRFYALFAALICLLGAIVFAFREKQSSFIIFGSMLLVFLPLMKIAIGVPYASALSPKQFIATELRDHTPAAICMNSGRMYAEVFYLRMLDPNLDVHDCHRKDSTLLVWAEDLSELDGVAYSHLSSEPIEKPNKRIAFVRRNF